MRNIRLIIIAIVAFTLGMPSVFPIAQSAIAVGQQQRRQRQQPDVSQKNQVQNDQTIRNRAKQIPGDRNRQIPRDNEKFPVLYQSDFEIPSNQDEKTVGFQVTGVGLYSAEISFRCEDSQRKNDRITMSMQSGDKPGLLRDQPGTLHFWFGRGHTLDPEVSYRFYFWVDEAMLQQFGADRTLRFILGRADRVRSREEGEFEARHRVNITLPRIAGRIHFRVPNPIVVEAKATQNPVPQESNIDQMDVLQYRVKVNFPRLGERESTRKLKAEFRVPVWRDQRNVDIGGFLLKNGRWQRQDQVRESGEFDFLVSPAMEFSKDANGRRLTPIEEDWTKFKKDGLLAKLNPRRIVNVNSLFYLKGGETPSDYYVVELEEIKLSSVPDEGDGAFWLRLNTAAALNAPEEASEPRAQGSEDSAIAQTRLLRIPIPPSGEFKGAVKPRLPLMVLPFSALEGKQGLVIGTEPHYFHDMPALEQANYIGEETGGYKFLEGLFSQDLKKLGEGIVTFLYKVGRAKNPDLYRTFGMDSFESDIGRGWGLQNSSARYTLEGGCHPSKDSDCKKDSTVSYKEVYGSSNRSLATVSDIAPGGEGTRSHTSKLRVRRVPGVFVEGATVKILSVKTNRNFEGNLKVYLGVAGHEGGRRETSNQGLKMESSAVGSPWSYWVYTISDRGPYNFRSGIDQAIDFRAIDFSDPERTPEGLYEQLSHTYGPWAALHVRVALGKIVKRDGQTNLSPKKFRYLEHYDEAFLTIYPYDYLLGELRGSSRREGDWMIISGTLPVHSYILDEITYEVRLRVQARDAAR